MHTESRYRLCGELSVIVTLYRCDELNDSLQQWWSEYQIPNDGLIVTGINLQTHWDKEYTAGVTLRAGNDKAKALINRNGRHRRIDRETFAISLGQGMRSGEFPEPGTKALAVKVLSDEKMEQVGVVSKGDEASQLGARKGTHEKVAGIRNVAGLGFGGHRSKESLDAYAVPTDYEA